MHEGEFFEVANLIGIAGIEGQNGVAEDALVFFAKLTADDGDELFLVEIEDGADHAEHEHVLATVTGRAAHGFHCRCGERHADILDATLILEVLLFHVCRVIKADAAIAQRADVGVVAVLVESHEHIRFVTRRENFTRANVDLEDGRAATNRGGNRHVSHDFLRGATREAG